MGQAPSGEVDPAHPRRLGARRTFAVSSIRCAHIARRLPPRLLRRIRTRRGLADEIVVLHPLTFAECLVGAARLGQLDSAADALRAAFQIVDVDVGAPIRWAELRASTSLRLPDAIVLDTAIVHAARMILTFDQQLAAEASTRAISSPRRRDEGSGLRP